MKVLSVLLLIFVYANILAQPVINANWYPSPGDNFVMQQLNYNPSIIYNTQGLGTTGGNVTWDFSHLSVGNSFDTISYSGTSDSIIRDDMYGSTNLYWWNSDSALLDVISTSNACGSYNGSVLIYYFPMIYSAYHSAQSSMITVGYADQGEQGNVGNEVLYAAWGKLLLPGNLQYDSVLMLELTADTACGYYDENGFPTSASSQTTYSYQWIYPGIKNPVLVINQWQNYSVTYSSEGVIGQSSIDSSSNAFVYQSSFFTGMPTLTLDEDLQLYPNPASDQLRLNTSVPNSTAVKIYDAMGRFVKQYPYSTIIDVSYLAPGYYVLELEFPEGRLIRQFGKL